VDTEIGGSSSGALTVATDKFNVLYGAGSAWGTAATTQSVMPVAGTLKNFKILFDTTNTGARTFAVYKNGVDTALTITIAAGAVSGSDLTHSVAFARGDTISIHATGGDGLTSVGVVRWTLIATCAANVSFILASSNAAMGTVFPVYVAAQGQEVDTVAGGNVEVVCPTSGTIWNARVQLNTAIGAGTNLTFTLVKNGVDTALVVVINTAVAIGNDTNAGHSVSVVQGDRLYWRVDSSAAPTTKTSFIGAEFDPVTNGESIHMYGGSKAQPTGTTIKYQTISEANAVFNATETGQQVLSQAAVWQKLTVYEQTAIATGSLKYILVKNGSQALSGPIVTISSGQTGQDNTNTVATASGDTMSMGVIPTSPTVSLVEWGIVSYIAPPVTADQNLSMMGIGG
jgi:hypothetical protein